MPEANPARITFNAGEFSALAEGRVDLDRYPAAMRSMINFIITPQGPALRRSGTQFIQTVHDETKKSNLVPFVYNEQQALVLEFGDFICRFMLEEGPQIYTPINVTNILATTPLQFAAAGHDFEIGETLVFQGFPAVRNMSLRTAKVTGVSGNNITVDMNYNGSTGAISGATAAKMYVVSTPYAQADVGNIRYVQSVDVLYLFCDGYRPYKLSRYGAYDWRFEPIDFKDGPYLPTNNTATRLTLSDTGNIIPVMSGGSSPTGVASASSEVAGAEAWKAFDNSLDTYWRGSAAQVGWLRYQFPTASDDIPTMSGATTSGVTMSASHQTTGREAWRAGDTSGSSFWETGTGVGSNKWLKVDFGAGTPKTIRTYSIRAITASQWEADTPRDWVLQGSNDNVNWTAVDTRTGQTAWSAGLRRQYSVSAAASYRYYRLYVTKVRGGSTSNWVKIAEIELFSDAVPGAVVATGYTIYVANDNDQTDYGSVDYAPGTFTFEGSNNGSSWEVLDRQSGYVLYDGLRSVHFPLKNENSYLYYRLNIKELRRNGNIGPRVGRLTIAAQEVSDITITASSTAGVNSDNGFQPTDVGRLIRLKGTDAIWRNMLISEYVSETQVKASLRSEPFVNLDSIAEFRLGAWSDTTGWPVCGTFFEDRLFMSGAVNQADLVAGSRTGAYEDFTQTSPTGEVLDDSAIVFRLNSRKLSRVRWLADDERGLLVGTGTGEWVVRPPDTAGALTARNIKARQSTSRGSAAIEPVQVDKQTLFVQSSRRTLREHAYVFEADGFKSPSMSLFASHLGSPRFAEIEYTAEPYSTIWIRRDDGSLITCTYLREENVVGWSRHEIGGGGEIESMASIPSVTEQQDVLYMVVKRTINGQTRRFIERMRKTWDFDSSLETAHFVDCALRYEGAAATVIYGLWFLEGATLHGLANGKERLSGLVVTNGSVTLPNAATNVVLGLQYVSFGEIARPEAGAAKGTAQGKVKRAHQAVMQLWDTLYGEIGRYSKQDKAIVWEDIPYEEDGDVLLEQDALTSDLTDFVVLPPGYDMDGTIAFRQTEPLPMNMVAIFQKMLTNE